MLMCDNLTSSAEFCNKSHQSQTPTAAARQATKMGYSNTTTTTTAATTRTTPQSRCENENTPAATIAPSKSLSSSSRRSRASHYLRHQMHDATIYDLLEPVALGKQQSSGADHFYGLHSCGANFQQQHYLTIEELRSTRVSCWLCGCNWQEDHVSLDCPECDGYALSRPCPDCGGKCKQVWTRNISSTHDRHKASWVGECSLNKPAAPPAATTTKEAAKSGPTQTSTTTATTAQQQPNLAATLRATIGAKSAAAKPNGVLLPPSSSSCCSSQVSSATSSDEEPDEPMAPAK